MRKLSKKAKRLIIDYSSAAADLTNKAIRPNFIQFGEARAALMDYIAELEEMVERLIEAGDDLAGFTMSATGDNGHSITLRKWHALVYRIQKEQQ